MPRSTLPTWKLNLLARIQCKIMKTPVGLVILPSDKVADRGAGLGQEHSLCSQLCWPLLLCAGDIVIAKNMQSPRYIICKRVLGLEGDQVRVQPSTGTDLPYTTIVSCCLYSWQIHRNCMQKVCRHTQTLLMNVSYIFQWACNLHRRVCNSKNDQNPEYDISW